MSFNCEPNFICILTSVVCHKGNVRSTGWINSQLYVRYLTSWRAVIISALDLILAKRSCINPWYLYVFHLCNLFSLMSITFSLFVLLFLWMWCLFFFVWWQRWRKFIEKIYCGEEPFFEKLLNLCKIPTKCKLNVQNTN